MQTNFFIKKKIKFFHSQIPKIGYFHLLYLP